MYKLVIIDDEKEQVEGIKTIIDWGKYDIEICGTADNGKNGLDLVKEKLPDIAIIDIRMPLMNGLELIEEINNSKLKMQYIILSGYDDFYYAQKAIQPKTSNYLLKPCRPEEILQSVLKAVNNISEEKRVEAILTSYEEIIDRNIPVLKENHLTRLITGQINDDEIIKTRIKRYNLDFSGTEGPFSVLIFSADFPGYLNGEEPDEKTEMLTIAVREMIAKELLQIYRGETLYYQNNIVAILEMGDKASEIASSLHSLVEKLLLIKENINETYNMSYSIAIGNPVTPLQSVWKSYQQAEIAMESRFFSDENNILQYESRLAEAEPEFLYPIQLEKQVLANVEHGKEENLPEALQGFFDRACQENSSSKKYIQTLGLTLVSNILHFCINKNIDLKKIDLNISRTFDYILLSNNIKQLQDEILICLTRIINEIKTTQNYTEIVQYTLDYIHDNYQKNITLQGIADEVNYSPSYLSLLFKQETGTNYIDYLNHYRVEKAKKLLEETNCKNYEIAYKVGYQDEKYFYQVFKRYTGLTASQYRESVNLFG